MTFQAIKFRAAYGYDTEQASRESSIRIEGESLTVQSHAKDADINNIMKAYGITGKAPINPRTPMYGDFTGIKGYQDALNAVILAEEGFMEFPAEIRARFHNNPQEMLDFCDNPANLKEAQFLGLLKENDNGDRGTESNGAGSRIGGGSPQKARKTGGGSGQDEPPAGGSGASGGPGEGSGANAT